MEAKSKIPAFYSNRLKIIILNLKDINFKKRIYKNN